MSPAGAEIQCCTIAASSNIFSSSEWPLCTAMYAGATPSCCRFGFVTVHGFLFGLGASGLGLGATQFGRSLRYPFQGIPSKESATRALSREHDCCCKPFIVRMVHAGQGFPCRWLAGNEGMEHEKLTIAWYLLVQTTKHVPLPALEVS